MSDGTLNQGVPGTLAEARRLAELGQQEAEPQRALDLFQEAFANLVRWMGTVNRDQGDSVRG